MCLIWLVVCGSKTHLPTWMAITTQEKDLKWNKQGRKVKACRNVYGRLNTHKHCVNCSISVDWNTFVGSSVISHHFLATKDEDNGVKMIKAAKFFSCSKYELDETNLFQNPSETKHWTSATLWQSLYFLCPWLQSLGYPVPCIHHWWLLSITSMVPPVEIILLC